MVVTNENYVVIELPLILALPIQLGHLLQRLKHCMYHFLVCRIHTVANFQAVCSYQLTFNARSIRREVLDELRNTSPLLTGKFCLLDAFQLISLPRNGLEHFLKC